jgi:hypothetical protein
LFVLIVDSPALGLISGAKVSDGTRSSNENPNYY